MNDLRTAAQQALAFTMRDFASLRDFEAAKAVLHDNLRAALAQQAEPVEELITRLFGTLPVHDTQQADPGAYGYASRLAFAIWKKHYKDIAPQWKPLDDLMGVLTQIDNMTSGLTLLAQQAEPAQEPDLSRCPQCNGPADNGHDRSIPPNPYLCTKCMAEMPQPSYNVTVVDDAHPNGIPLEQWQNKQVQKPGAVHQFRKQYCANWYDGYPDHTDGGGPYEERTLYTAPPQRKPLSEDEIEDLYFDGFSISKLKEFARAIERAHGIKERV